MLMATPLPALAQPSSKIDVELQEALKRSSPSEPIAVIVVFQGRPTDEQIGLLKTEHRMNVTHIYRIINGVAGRAPAEEIPRIAERSWVKEVWLDRRVYVAQDRAVDTSQLIDELQGEVTELEGRVQAQQERISQLEAGLKAYPLIALIAGLALGTASTAAVARARRRTRTLTS
jgi:hypothetical protein